jgi:type I restriction enzyme R subunit
VDEAHSSQTGEGAKDLKLVLTTPEALQAIIAQDDENREWTDPVAEELAKVMKGRQRLPHLSFFAFTATPKPKTLEVFGKPCEVLTTEGGKKVDYNPFHTYSMRQAIEEEFVFDVLQNYTTYGTYFELLKNEKAPPGYAVETEKGRRLLLKLVGNHPHTIESKAKIMLDHFFSKTVHKIDGEAKAMVVTSSRAHAVLYKQTIDRLLREDYASQTRALVAFSGKVLIKGQGAAHLEDEMNPKDAKDIREAFKKQKYRILIVANKFQTGFDQPLLHTMYVDKKLGGVATVQTLSRLNRKGPPAKLDTMVLDFVNKQEDIQADFQKYYGKTTLDRGTNPQKLYNLKFEVEAPGVFTLQEVNNFAELFVVQKAPGHKISPLFTRIIQGRFSTLTEEEQGNFRDALERYVYQYSFISQIISWIDPELEKFYLFTKLLLKYLPPQKGSLPKEILDMVDMDKFRLQEQQNGSIVLSPGNTELINPPSDGHKSGGKQEKAELESIVKELNERFYFDFEDRDKVMRIVIPKLANDQGLVAAFQTDNLETLRRQKFAESLENAFIASASDFYSVLNRMSAEPDFKRLLTEFALREFKRGLQSPGAAVDSPNETRTVEVLSKRANAYVSQNFGPTVKWTAINSAVWRIIDERKNHEITLTDVDEVAKTVHADSSEVLAVLALLSRPASGLLTMRYRADDADGAEKVSKEDMATHLKAWWRDKKIDDDAWRAWAGKVIVKWSPAMSNEDSK